MMIRSSFKEEKPTLYLIATPIGNLSDLSFRALETLKNVHYLYAEDTRVTRVLLNHYGIHRSVFSYHKFNEEEKLIEIKKHLENGFSVGFCSDAGMPGISDPGYLLVRYLKQIYPVVVIPGAVAYTTALVASGLKIMPHTFIGFLEGSKSNKIKTINNYKTRSETLLIYESAVKLHQTLKLLYEILGSRKVVVARELTKLYESFYEFNLGDDASLIELKGEMVIIIEGYIKEEINDEDILKYLKELMNQNYSLKDAVKQASNDLDVSKNKVYELATKNKL